jgi:uncharacterized phage protein gp47/JayE
MKDTSELESLERQGVLYGITRKAATFAVGNVTFAGNDGTLIATGTLLQRSDGQCYTTQADATIAAGTATAAVQAETAGEAGNAAAGVSLALVSPIIGVGSSATVAVGGLALGSDQESDDDLRTRIIERLRFAPQGGAATDYVAWAKKVAGVTRAWAFPPELGLGTVTVRFVRDDDASIIPDGAGDGGRADRRRAELHEWKLSCAICWHAIKSCPAALCCSRRSAPPIGIADGIADYTGIRLLTSTSCVGSIRTFEVWC